MLRNLLAPNLEPTTQRIVLNGHEIEFELKRSRRRRSIGLKIDFAGLIVTAPPRASVRSIRSALQDNAQWVLRKVEAWRARTPPVVQWSQGASLPYLGSTITLNILLQPRKASAPWLDLAGLNLTFKSLPSGDQIKAKVCDWYRGEAKRYFPQRIDQLATVAKIPAPRFFLSNAQSRWGGCPASLTWRLMKAAPSVIDYVAAHELAHLAHMDHSPRFWRRVAEIFPQYEVALDELRRNDALYRIF
jgi:predicted metal-dependent hydrolase